MQNIRSKFDLTKFLLLFFLAIHFQCTPSLTKKPSESISSTDAVFDRLTSLSSRIISTKRIFKLRVYDDGRTYLAEGALIYKNPDRLRLDVISPFGDVIVQLSQVGDSLTVILPERGIYMSGGKSDERFRELAESEGLATGEFLGGILGMYDVNDFLDAQSRLYQTEDSDNVILSIEKGKDVYQFTLDREDLKLINYKRGVSGTVIREVKFENFEIVDGINRPFKIVYRDYLKNREIIAVVKKERLNQPIENIEFNLPNRTVPESY